MYLLGRKSLSCFFAPRHVGNGENLSSHPDDSEFTPQVNTKFNVSSSPARLQATFTRKCRILHIPLEFLVSQTWDYKRVNLKLNSFISRRPQKGEVNRNMRPRPTKMRNICAHLITRNYVGSLSTKIHFAVLCSIPAKRYRVERSLWMRSKHCCWFITYLLHWDSRFPSSL